MLIFYVKEYPYAIQEDQGFDFRLRRPDSERVLPRLLHADQDAPQVIACLIFGIIGFTFKKLEIPTTPFILGFILGPLAEVNYRRGMIRTKGSFVPFLTSPISAVFLIIAVAIIVLYATKPMREKRKAAE